VGIRLGGREAEAGEKRRQRRRKKTGSGEQLTCQARDTVTHTPPSSHSHPFESSVEKIKFRLHCQILIFSKKFLVFFFLLLDEPHG
jgi:hypothetical protein